MSTSGNRRLALARLLSSAVLSQALLSAASFAVGLLLIRHTAAAQYGYFILATNAIALLASLQNAFFGPALATRLNRLDLAGREKLVGGLYAGQRRLLRIGAAALLAAAALLWATGVLDAQTGPLVITTALVALALLHREYFRLVLLAYRRPHDVLRTDLVYVVLMVLGVWLATWAPAGALAAVFALGLAAAASALLLAQALHRHEPWNGTEGNGVLRSIAPLAAWSTAGAAIHWTFSQGTLYLVAATLDVTAVAAIAATRLLLMPVNLLSTGIGSLMLPLASGWLHRHGAGLLLRRLGWFALGLSLVTVCYLSLLWLLRDWIFTVVFRKQIAARDPLLLLWGMVFLVLVVRDQLVYLLAAQGRFRAMTLLTLVSAVVSLAASYVGMLRLGVTGALVGMLAGELLSLGGTVVLSLRQHPPTLALAA